MTVNKAILVGNLGQDPELRMTGGGTPVVTLRIATTHRSRTETETGEIRPNGTAWSLWTTCRNRFKVLPQGKTTLCRRANPNP